MRKRSMVFAALAVITLAAEAAGQPGVRIFERPTRNAWLGFSYDAVRDHGEDEVVVVRDVVSGSPAEDAGVAAGDTIVRINDIRATESFIGSLGAALSPGDAVRVEVRRGNSVRELTITAAKPPAEYVRLGPASGFMMFDDDSVRSMVRILMDSAAASVDAFHMPDVFFEYGDHDAFMFHADSLRPFTLIDTLIVSPDSTRRFRLRFLHSDSLRAEFDSLRMRLRAGDHEWVAPFRDSLIGKLRRGGDAWVHVPGDSTFDLRLGLRPFSITRPGLSAIAGAELTRLDPAMEDYFGVGEGVLVIRVPRDSPAARAGLQAGDVIVRVNGADVTSVESLRRAILRPRDDAPARLEVIRKRQTVTVELRRD